jgi:hypothetical protein
MGLLNLLRRLRCPGCKPCPTCYVQAYDCDGEPTNYYTTCEILADAGGAGTFCVGGVKLVFSLSHQVTSIPLGGIFLPGLSVRLNSCTESCPTTDPPVCCQEASGCCFSQDSSIVIRRMYYRLRRSAVGCDGPWGVGAPSEVEYDIRNLVLPWYACDGFWVTWSLRVYAVEGLLWKGALYTGPVDITVRRQGVEGWHVLVSNYIFDRDGPGTGWPVGGDYFHVSHRIGINPDLPEADPDRDNILKNDCCEGRGFYNEVCVFDADSFGGWRKREAIDWIKVQNNRCCRCSGEPPSHNCAWRNPAFAIGTAECADGKCSNTDCDALPAAYSIAVAAGVCGTIAWAAQGITVTKGEDCTYTGEINTTHGVMEVSLFREDSEGCRWVFVTPGGCWNYKTTPYGGGPPTGEYEDGSEVL